MNSKDAVEFVDELVFAKEERHLKDNERFVIEGSWEGLTYREISDRYPFRCEYEHLERNIGPQLWCFLSDVLGKHVSKNNLHGPVEAAWKEKHRSSSNPRQDARETLLPTQNSVVKNLASSLPSLAEPESPEGLVPLNSHFYIARDVESLCYQEINHPGALIRIKAPQKMGKTSLLERIVSEAEKQGYETVNLSFQPDRTIFSDLYKFTRYFCAYVSKQLGMDHQLDNYWDNTCGCVYNVTDYFEKYLLAERSNPLVLALDNFDFVFEQTEIANESCQLLRSWHNDLAKRSSDRGMIWKKIRLIVVHSTNVYGSLDIINSPLNGVGLVISLEEFGEKQVTELARRYELNYEAPDIEQLIKLVGGHPYLLRLALNHLKSHQASLAELVQIASKKDGPFRDYLRQHLEKLQNHQEIATAFRKVIKANEPVTLNDIEAFKLESMGLVKMEDEEHWIPSCSLYSQYFQTQFDYFY